MPCEDGCGSCKTGQDLKSESSEQQIVWHKGTHSQEKFTEALQYRIGMSTEFQDMPVVQVPAVDDLIQKASTCKNKERN